MAEAAVGSYLGAHYRHLLDDSLPETGGATPRQAAATRRGRRQVIDRLKDVGNAEHRRAAQQGLRPCDTAWIWRELGMEAHR